MLALQSKELAIEDVVRVLLPVCWEKWHSDWPLVADWVIRVRVSDRPLIVFDSTFPAISTISIQSVRVNATCALITLTCAINSNSILVPV